MGWKAAPHITSQWGHTTLLERGLPAPLSTLPPKNHVSSTSNYNYWSFLCNSSLFVWGEKCIFLLSAPSQPPVKVMWNTSDSKIILNWEHVKALENESEVTGYKVSTQSPGFTENCICCHGCGAWLLTWLSPFVRRCCTKRIDTAAPTSWKPTPPLWSLPSPLMRIISSR